MSSSINWIHLCDYAFYKNGKPSLIGVFKEVYVPFLPFDPFPVYAVIDMTVDAVGIETRVSVLLGTGNGETLSVQDGEPFIPERSPHHYAGIFGFTDFTFEEAGDYHLEIFVNGQSVHVVPFPVILTG